MTGSRSEPAVGIDLGTTFSVIAHLDSTERPCTVPNAEGDLLTPSVVLFDDAEVVVGKEALKAAVALPDDVAQHAKRYMGNSAYAKPIHGESLPPEVIQSFVLKKLRQDASLKLGQFRSVVISVPAFFNEPRRKATQDAGALAELEVLDIINEPTAAAIAFGVQEGFLTASGEAKQKETVIVYDLGGGTFDVTLMEIDGKDFTALATAGDVQLGGIDWDRRIVDHVAETVMQRQSLSDPRQEPVSMQRLLREAEDAKRTLSTRDQATVTLEHDGKAVRVPVNRRESEEMTGDLLDRTRFTTTNLVQDADITWSDITRVLLVGGSSRMPAVQQMLEELTGRPPDRSLAADEAVAHGAALYAGFLLKSRSGEAPRMSVRNVNSHDLGVLGIERATSRPRTRVMIARNTRLPAERAERFALHRDGQSSVVVNVVEGGDASGNDATHIGKCVIRDLPADLPAGTPVEVTFSYGEDGRLKIRARLPSDGSEAVSEIERESGLTADTLQSWNARIRGPFSSPVADQVESPPPLPGPTELADDQTPPPLPPIDDHSLPPALPGAPVDEPPPLPQGDEPPPLPASSD